MLAESLTPIVVGCWSVFNSHSPGAACDEADDTSKSTVNIRAIPFSPRNWVRGWENKWLLIVVAKVCLQRCSDLSNEDLNVAGSQKKAWKACP